MKWYCQYQKRLIKISTTKVVSFITRIKNPSERNPNTQNEDAHSSTKNTIITKNEKWQLPPSETNTSIHSMIRIKENTPFQPLSTLDLYIGLKPTNPSLSKLDFSERKASKHKGSTGNTRFSISVLADGGLPFKSISTGIDSFSLLTKQKKEN